MAKLDMSKGSDGFNMMGDVFRFIANYGTPENNDEYWAKVVEEHHKLCSKYEGNETVYHLAVCIMTSILCNHLEVVEKRGREKK